ncbi:MAG: Acetyl-coenzyme A carboxyl transferase alpha chain / Acetyl-coenzyme A carboxyl transferase beta chain; Propionyl-CoA carboxylase beta chain [uncultured Thermomicrobiales bacterium]|uniref:Propionyl-CoA carboxylase beta chain n=1 Tax=uncultured Thermomicrobiales bacterium TaxID=1645740 RepID=A0A6J4V2D6_9BACT|nr:MAG: Acetyl-coenzyme A carboxyl transferase alpha chain / Acetyl-coenzyme A carboxyl transferase beta chain; Propionyl-CoA carboxylase beta chain [uncultured Thermomicrobiales bacterium]
MSTPPHQSNAVGVPTDEPATEDGHRPSKAGRLAAMKEEIAAQHAAAAAKQAERGKRGARERVLTLLDEGSFRELDPFVRHRATDFGLERSRPFGDGVVTGFGEIDGRPVAVFSQDFTVFGGSLGEAFAAKVVKLMDLAERYGCPIVGINDSAGARIQEGVEGLAGYGEVFLRNVRASGVVPQISVIAGPCAGGAVYSPAMTDFVLMVEGVGQMFITGPEVIKTVTGETVTHDALGGAATHHAVTGVAHLVAADEDDANAQVRVLLSFLPSNNLDDPPSFDPADDPVRDSPELDALVPETSTRPYDVHDLLAVVLDDGDFFETQAAHAANIVCGFGRLDGRSVGVVANQPKVLAGTLDIAASEKAARFVRTCDAFNVPLVTFVDVPGFLPGIGQEHEGIIRHGSKLLYAYAEATVPKVTVITRKAYGGAYVVMCSKHLGADANVAWPTAEIAVMGPDAAVGLVFRRELATAPDPTARRRELIAEYEELFASPYQAASRGYVDDVIEPRRTRPWLIKALALARGKRVATPARKHGNIPL